MPAGLLHKMRYRVATGARCAVPQVMLGLFSTPWSLSCGNAGLRMVRRMKEKDDDRTTTAFPAAQAIGRRDIQGRDQLVPAAPGRRGQGGQDGTYLHRGGAVVRRRPSAGGDRAFRLGAGGRAGCPAVDGLAGGPVKKR